MIFALIQDFTDILDAMPHEHSRRRILKLLDEAIRRDAHFVHRHPMTLFQCLWNSCWWYDSSAAAVHYDLRISEKSFGHQTLPWELPIDKRISPLLERWRAEKERGTPGFHWVRALSPPTQHLGTAQLAVFRGHEDGVSSVVFSPNGRLIISGSGDKTIRIWDALNAQEISVFRGHEGSVESIAFSPDGRRIVSGSGDCTARIWNVLSGTELYVLRGHTDTVRSVAFSPDGSRIVSGSNDYTTRIWSVESGAELCKFHGSNNAEDNAPLTMEAQLFLNHIKEKVLKLDVNSDLGLRLFRRLSGYEHGMNSVAFSPNGRHIVSCSNDKTVRVWDVDSGAELQILRSHQDRVQCVAYSPDGRWILSGSYDKTLLLWNSECYKQSHVLRGHENTVSSAAFSPDGRMIVSGSSDKTVRVWESESGQQLRILRGHESAVWSVAFSPDGQWIVSGSSDMTVRVWSTQAGEKLRLLRGHERKDRTFSFSSDGRYVVIGASDNSVRVWDTESCEETLVLCGHAGEVVSVCFSNDGTQIASGSSDQTIRIWDVQSGETLRIFGVRDGSVNGVAFSPDGARIASGACLAFSPDGQRIVSNSDYEKIQVWDTKSGAILVSYPEHLASFTGLPSSMEDWDHIMSAPRRVADELHVLSSGSCTFKPGLSGHLNKVTKVAFSQDGQRIISCSSDSVRIWSADQGNLLQILTHGNVSVIAKGRGWWARNLAGSTLIQSIDSSDPIAWLAGELLQGIEVKDCILAGWDGNRIWLGSLEGNETSI